MKITLLSTSDVAGGAAIACLRLAAALDAYGHQVRVLVVEKKSAWPQIIEVSPSRRKADKLLKVFQHVWNKSWLVKSGYDFSANPWWDHNIHSHPAILDAEVLNIHWINHGYLGLDSLQKVFALGKPIFWHMHDFWAFTGGCHYPGSCSNFETGCGDCAALQNRSANDLSRELFLRKQALFKLNPPVLVGASAWLTAEAAKSALVKSTEAQTKHIPNPIDLSYYNPSDRASARTEMGLSPHKKYLLFAAMNAGDPRKGFAQLKRALQSLADDLAPTTELLVAGKADPEIAASLTFKTHLLGGLDQAAMRMAYRAADVFMIPSLEENLPNTILESLACGTPVAGFDAGGIPEMVHSGMNGFLAPVGNSEALAQAVRACLLLEKDVNTIAKSVYHFEASEIATRYTALLLSNR